MKKLFLAIFIPILVILGTPALLVTIMYDGSGEDLMPVHLYTEDANAEAMLYEELTSSLDDVTNEVEEDFIFNLHEDIINTAIFEAIRDSNADYMPLDDCATPEACYAVYEQIPIEDFDLMLRVVGAWVDFNDDTFSLNVFLEVELEDGFTYKTVVSTQFIFKDEADHYLLQFDRISVGNLPVPASAITSVLNALENNLEDFDTDEIVADIPYGDADLSEFSFKMYKDEIVELVGGGDDVDCEVNPEDDACSTDTKMMKQVLSEVFEQRIIIFKFVGDELIASGQLSLFVSEDETALPDYLYDLHEVDPVTGDIGAFDPNALDTENYLKDKFVEYMFNYALVPDGGFNITEEMVNSLIYSQQGGFEDMKKVEEIEMPDGTMKTLEFGVEGIWFEFSTEGIQAKALVKLDSIDSVMILKATKVESLSTDTELVFDFTEITFGEDVGETETDYVSVDDLTVFKEMLAEMGDVEFGVFDEYGVLTVSAQRLSDLMQEGTEEGAVVVESIELVEDAIVLGVVPADETLAAAMDAISTELNNIIEDPTLLTNLEGVLDTTDGGTEQEVYESVVELQETLQNDEVPDAEQVEELFENFVDLDPETQTEFLETFEDLIDEDVLADWEALYGELSEDDIPEGEIPLP